jgi:hypothetical protein
VGKGSSLQGMEPNWAESYKIFCFLNKKVIKKGWGWAGTVAKVS